jgi:hypothetical protein
MRMHPDNIKAYSFVSFSIDRILDIDRHKLSTLCMYPNKMTEIKGVEPNFLDAIDLNYYMPTEYDDNLPKKYLSSGQRDGIRSNVYIYLFSKI